MPGFQYVFLAVPTVLSAREEVEEKKMSGLIDAKSAISPDARVAGGFAAVVDAIGVDCLQPRCTSFPGRRNMRTVCKLAFMAVILFLAGNALGQAPPMAVRVGNATANDAQAAMNAYMAGRLTQYSNGRIKASSHPGEALGNNAQMVAALQAGALQVMIIPAGFLAAVVPEVSLFDLPFLLPADSDKVTAFTSQSKAAERMRELAGQKGIHILSFYGTGSQHLLTRFPVSRLTDLQGKRFRVIPSPPRIGTYNDWGSVPRPMELGEVYTALQQGTVDGIENPLDTIYRNKLHEVAKYLTLTNHSGFVNALIVSKKWFDALAKDLQDVVLSAGRDTLTFGAEAITRQNIEGLEALKRSINVTEMPPAEIKRMRDATHKGVWEKMKGDPQRGPIVRLLEEDIARFNKQ